ncbi:MAG TPA: hypothetical protein DEA79_25245, partial [Cyanobacteria bacterium UBA11153]|nr:hypothetical protein [Cyanobacteria bacterium UBA11153]
MQNQDYATLVSSVISDSNNSSTINNASSATKNTQGIKFDPKYEWCAESGVTEEYCRLLISTGCLGAYEASDVKKLLSLPKLELSGDMFWGIRSIDPAQKSTLCIGKKGLQIKTGGKPKYRTPYGGDTDAIFLPLPEGKPWVRAATEGVIAVTEGGKKAASLISNGNLPTISVTGVDCAAPTLKDGKVRERLNCVLSFTVECSEEPTAIIVFDMDFVRNKDVLRALIKAHEAYLAKGFQKVFTPVWDEKYKGVDDAIAAVEPSERKNWINANIRNPKEENKMTLDKLKQIWEKQFAKKKVSASDKKLDGEEIVELILDEYRTNWKWCNQLGYWLHWNGKTWDKKDNKTVAANTQSLLKSRGIRYGSSSKLNDVVEQLSNDLFVETWEPADRKRYIAFNNGVYDTEISKLLPHQQGYMLTSCLSRDFEDIEVNQEETLEQLLKQYCPEFWKAYSWQFDDDDYKVLKLLAVIAGCLTFQFR